MPSADRGQIVAMLLERHGRTYADEIGFDPVHDTPSSLFRLLCAAQLFSARIDSSIAVEAAKSLAARGWNTAEKLAASSWDERVEALNEAGYTRYQEQTASWLGETADLLVDRYRGDLRRLRDEAGRDPGRERALLKDFKGIGDVAVDVFFREAQDPWDELYPFVDDRALAGAGTLGLPTDAAGLAELVDRATFPTLVAALVRVDIEDIDEL
jgi:endonuclease III